MKEGKLEPLITKEVFEDNFKNGWSLERIADKINNLYKEKMKRDDYRDLHDQIKKLKRGYQIRNVLIWIVLMSIIAFLALSCSKDELAQPKQPTFTEVAQIDAEPLGNLDIVLDTIPVEEYYTVTSKLSSATPDSIWSDTITRTVIRPLSRWLEDGFTFVENRRDTSIIYLDGTQGVWMSEEWDYWTLED